MRTNRNKMEIITNLNNQKTNELPQVNTASSKTMKTVSVKETFTSSQKSKSFNIELSLKYINDLRNKFKLNEETINTITMNKNFESYYNELKNRINSSKTINNNGNNNNIMKKLENIVKINLFTIKKFFRIFLKKLNTYSVIKK
jgi:hypothetical protein